MRDAGEALAGAGASMGGAGAGMLSTAGNAVAGAGRALAGAAAGSGGTAGAKAQESTGDGLPRPHWVLRDKDGAPVQAEVQPGYAKTVRFASGGETCVWIEHAGTRAIQLGYDLTSGKVAKWSECSRGSSVTDGADWHAIIIAYADDACAGTTYQSTTRAELMPMVNGVLYYTSEDAAPSSATLYAWNAAQSKCEAAPNSMPINFRAMKPVPSEVVNLLPNAPYTLELVY